MSKWGNAKHWTAASAIQAIQHFHAEWGTWPTSRDCHDPTTGLPSRVTLFRLFGSLAEARLQAGAADGGHRGHGGGGRGGGWEKGRKRLPRLASHGPGREQGNNL